MNDKALIIKTTNRAVTPAFSNLISLITTIDSKSKATKSNCTMKIKMINQTSRSKREVGNVKSKTNDWITANKINGVCIIITPWNSASLSVVLRNKMESRNSQIKYVIAVEIIKTNGATKLGSINEGNKNIGTADIK